MNVVVGLVSQGYKKYHLHTILSSNCDNYIWSSTATVELVNGTETAQIGTVTWTIIDLVVWIGRLFYCDMNCV